MWRTPSDCGKLLDARPDISGQTREAEEVRSDSTRAALSRSKTVVQWKTSLIFTLFREQFQFFWSEFRFGRNPIRAILALVPRGTFPTLTLVPRIVPRGTTACSPTTPPTALRQISFHPRLAGPADLLALASSPSKQTPNSCNAMTPTPSLNHPRRPCHKSKVPSRTPISS